MRGYELTDFEWGVIQPLLPNKPRGVPRVDDRRVLNGIFWGFANRCAVAYIAQGVWPAHDLVRYLASVLPVEGPDFQIGFVLNRAEWLRDCAAILLAEADSL